MSALEAKKAKLEKMRQEKLLKEQERKKQEELINRRSAASAVADDRDIDADVDNILKGSARKPEVPALDTDRLTEAQSIPSSRAAYQPQELTIAQFLAEFNQAPKLRPATYEKEITCDILTGEAKVGNDESDDEMRPPYADHPV